MKIAVIGCGYLGAVHAACMAKLGHIVVGVESDARRAQLLAQGIPPFHEPDFPELLAEQVTSGRLRFTTESTDASESDVYFICVGTPQQQGSMAADTSYVDSAVSSLLRLLERHPALVVGKSTVPVGTAENVEDRIKAVSPSSNLIWNPEFLREGFAVGDTLSPDRIVYGVSRSSSTDATIVLDEVYEDLIMRQTIPRITTDLATAQLIKVAANAFLATKISFINAMAEICEAVGGNVHDLADAIGRDDRIGSKFLRAGIGFGGGCLPKDIRAFQSRAAELGLSQSLAFLKEVDDINKRRRQRVVDLIREAADGDLTNKTVAVLGAAFKPNSDDIRDSPAVDVATRLADLGATIQIYDPAVPHERLASCHPGFRIEESIEAAMTDADVTAILTEWTEFQKLYPTDSLRQCVAMPILVDGRNALNGDKWIAAGWNYLAPGVGSIMSVVPPPID